MSHLYFKVGVTSWKVSLERPMESDFSLVNHNLKIQDDFHASAEVNAVVNGVY